MISRQRLAALVLFAATGAMLSACAGEASNAPVASTAPSQAVQDDVQSSAEAPSPTSTARTWVDSPIESAITFEDVEAKFESYQTPVLLVSNGGTFRVTGLPAGCTLTPDYQYWGSLNDEREVGGIGYEYEGDILAISATDTPDGWSTTARFGCGSGKELKVEVTS